jgi:hypothetical protein
MNERNGSHEDKSDPTVRSAVLERGSEPYDRAVKVVIAAAESVCDARSRRVGRPSLEDALRALEDAVAHMKRERPPV